MPKYKTSDVLQAILNNSDVLDLSDSDQDITNQRHAPQDAEGDAIEASSSVNSGDEVTKMILAHPSDLPCGRS